MVQYACTPWDFIVSRADANGLVVAVTDGVISVAPIKASGKAKHVFKFGFDIIDLELETDAQAQPAKVESIGWDQKEQKLTQPSAATDSKLSIGNLQGEALGEKLGFEKQTLSHPVPVAAQELET
jgi:phage protein D